MDFNSDQWLNDRRLELVNLMFNQELGISDFKNTSAIINYDDLQSKHLIKSFDKYRKALRAFFGADEVRSLLDYYYIEKDKKPLLNLLKQILKCYGYKFSRVSEYQGNFGGNKLYKSRYTIIKSNSKQENDDETTEVDITEESVDDRLEKLTRLEELHYPEELPKLEKLPRLEELEELPRVEELEELPRLEELEELPRLEELEELPRVEELEELPRLEELEELPRLEEPINIDV
jgi:hypothetical protein